MSEPIHLECPQCKALVIWNEDFPHRPFCSKRCQLIDFGDWAEEKHRIPGELDADDDSL
ncbi:MAG: DNA gyrase inhibitor YacG, partial [Cellvibrionaceae bacterium]